MQIRKARLIKQCKEYILLYPIFRKALPSFIRVLQTVAFGNWYVTIWSKKSLFVSTTYYSILHLLLPSDAATTSLAFLYKLNYATLLKTTYLRADSFQCGSYCSTCTFISKVFTSYTFHSTDETRSLTHHITCNFKNLIWTIWFSANAVRNNT